MRTLARLEAETHGYHRDADAIWLALLSPRLTRSGYPELQPATRYLDDPTAHARWRALGIALDRIARTPRIEDQLAAAAHTAFHTVTDWYFTRPQDVRLGA